MLALLAICFLCQDPIPQPKVQNLVQAILVKWEIMDVSECDDIFVNWETGKTQIEHIIERMKLLRDCPLSDSFILLPSLDTVSAQMKFNRSYDEYLRRAFALRRSKEIVIIIGENQYLYNLLEDICRVHLQDCPIWVRRMVMKEILEKVGDGPFPPHVPLWRFQEIGN